MLQGVPARLQAVVGFAVLLAGIGGPSWLDGPEGLYEIVTKIAPTTRLRANAVVPGSAGDMPRSTLPQLGNRMPGGVAPVRVRSA